MSYGIIFCGNLSHSSVFCIQKRQSIMEGCGKEFHVENYWRNKNFAIDITISTLVMSVVQNKNLFSTNIEKCNIDTRQITYTCPKQTTIYQKGAYYLGIKIFNNLPMKIQNVASNLKKFKIALKEFLYTYWCYTLEEYFSQSWIMYCITKILILALVLKFCLMVHCISIQWLYTMIWSHFLV